MFISDFVYSFKSSNFKDTLKVEFLECSHPELVEGPTSLLKEWINQRRLGIYIKKILYCAFLITVSIQPASLKEKPITIIIPSYNNQKWCELNIQSALAQEYQNYSIIFIDDCSSDATFDLVQQKILASAQSNKVKIIRNSDRKGALANLYDAIHSCPDDMIIVTLDGDDFLAHNQVLKRVNLAYQDPLVWLTYGQFIEYPRKFLGHNKAIPNELIANRDYRSWEILPVTHLRTFYAGLFKRIKKEDLCYKGEFLPMAWDVAMLIPMLEMADGRIEYIPDILYMYNNSNPLSDHRTNNKLQLKLGYMIKSWPPYKPLSAQEGAWLFKSNKLDQNAGVDLIIFSFDRPMQLYALLESIEWYSTGLNSIQVIYRVSNDDFEQAYTQVKNRFSDVRYYKQGSSPAQDFKPLTISALENAQSPYILFAVDDIIVKDYVDLSYCAQLLEKYSAYGFYLRLGTHLNWCYPTSKKQPLPPFRKADHGLCVWQFLQGSGDWGYPRMLDMALYRKDTVTNDLQNIDFTNPTTLETIWANNSCEIKKEIGISFTHTKIVNIPLNMVQTEFKWINMNAFNAGELLELFTMGCKIDCSEFFRIENKAGHLEFIPHFILRN